MRLLKITLTRRCAPTSPIKGEVNFLECRA